MAIQEAILTEKLFHIVWERLYFDTQHLSTTSGATLHIISTGRYNTNQGPDFLHAKIDIEGVIWHGHIELHIDAQDWYRHQHHLDTHYNVTVLHVVLQTDGRPIIREDGTQIPELLLTPYLDKQILHRYDQLRLSEDVIPCGSHFSQITGVVKHSWIERLAVERMQAKALAMQNRLQTLKQDWEQVLWEELSGMMGGPVNKENFRQLATNVPLQLIQKYVAHPLQVDALLFGASGMLNTSPAPSLEDTKHPDYYYHQLYKEWQFLKAKHKLYNLSPIPFKRLRMRPAALPPIRIAQLARLICTYPQLIRLTEPEQFTDLLDKQISPHPYWETHFQFFDLSSSQNKPIGSQQKELLLINVLIPFSWLYHHLHGREIADELIEKGLYVLKPENNRITRQFKALLMDNPNAFYSQGMIQLYKHYCVEKKCLHCHIGQHIISGKSATNPG